MMKTSTVKRTISVGKRCFALILLACVFISCFLTYPVEAAKKTKVKEYKLSTTEVTSIKGIKFRVRLKNCKEKIVWTSSDETIAKVNSKGNVKGVSEGSCIITATVGSRKYECQVNILDHFDVDKAIQLIESKSLKGTYSTSTVDQKTHLRVYSYRYAYHLNDLFIECGIPTNRWYDGKYQWIEGYNLIEYLYVKKHLKLIDTNKAKAGDIIAWVDSAYLDRIKEFKSPSIYGAYLKQPSLITKVDSDGQIYTYLLHKSGLYSIPNCRDYPDYTMVVFRLSFK